MAALDSPNIQRIRRDTTCAVSSGSRAIAATCGRWGASGGSMGSTSSTKTFCLFWLKVVMIIKRIKTNQNKSFCKPNQIWFKDAEGILTVVTVVWKPQNKNKQVRSNLLTGSATSIDMTNGMGMFTCAVYGNGSVFFIRCQEAFVFAWGFTLTPWVKVEVP